MWTENKHFSLDFFAVIEPSLLTFYIIILLIFLVDMHDLKFDEIEKSLHEGNDNFREQAETNEVLIRSTFALLEFEVHYCETEHKPISKNLEKAKDDLHDYLAKK